LVRTGRVSTSLKSMGEVVDGLSGEVLADEPRLLAVAQPVLLLPPMLIGQLAAGSVSKSDSPDCAPNVCMVHVQSHELHLGDDGLNHA
jgi:hypothetical protein